MLHLELCLGTFRNTCSPQSKYQMRMRQETYAENEDVRQAYCEHMCFTVDGIFGKCSGKRPFLKGRSAGILPLLINPGVKTGMSPLHMQLITWELRALPRGWLRAVYQEPQAVSNSPDERDPGRLPLVHNWHLSTPVGEGGQTQVPTPSQDQTQTQAADGHPGIQSLFAQPLVTIHCSPA